MSGVDWYVEGIEFGSCNCVYACPCQFEALPTGGYCRGFEAVHIEKGRFGDVVLDGLNVALLYAWPGPIFEGKGEMLAIIDERATHWWVYRSMSDTVHPPIFKTIEFEANVDARSGRVMIPGVLESMGRPIKSPATGAEHRVRIDIPNGIEFEFAEIGSATTTSRSAIRLDLTDTYGQFNRLHHSRSGVVHR